VINTFPKGALGYIASNDKQDTPKTAMSEAVWTLPLDRFIDQEIFRPFSIEMVVAGPVGGGATSITAATATFYGLPTTTLEPPVGYRRYFKQFGAHFQSNAGGLVVSTGPYQILDASTALIRPIPIRGCCFISHTNGVTPVPQPMHGFNDEIWHLDSYELLQLWFSIPAGGQMVYRGGGFFADVKI